MIAGLATLLACVVAVTAPQAPSKNSSLEALDWLLGTWEARGKKSTMLETWRREADGGFAGASYRVTGADTVLAEKTRLEADSTGIWFVADVKHNKGLVRFRLASIDSLGVHFENPKHDYPTSVHYRVVHPDSLHAWISGEIDGKTRKLDFHYRRVK